MPKSPIPPELQQFAPEWQIQQAFEAAVAASDWHQAIAVIEWALTFEAGQIVLKRYRKNQNTMLTLVLDPAKHPVDLKLVRLLVGAGVPLEPDLGCNTAPLYNAILSGNLPAVQLLLEHGARLERTNYSPTPLPQALLPLFVLAVEAGQSEIALHFLQAGLDPHGIEAKVRPLQVAARYGDIRVAQALLELGVDINYKENQPKPTQQPHANYYATEPAIVEAAKVDGNPVLELLLSHGAAFDAQDSQGNTALEMAALPYSGILHRPQRTILRNFKSHAPQNLRFLLQHGFEKERLSRTLAYVHRPKMHGDDYSGQMHTVVGMLLEHGADPNFEDVRTPPLETALSTSSIRLVLMLLRAGADVKNLETDLWTLAYEGETPEHLELTSIVTERNITPDPAELQALFNRAVRDGDTERVKLLIAQKADVNAGRKRAPLVEASYCSYADIIQALVNAGANPNVRDEKTGYTPLMLAIVNQGLGSRKVPNGDSGVELLNAEKLASVDALIAAGANLQEVEEDGLTALHLAVRYAPAPVVRALLEAGADVNALGNNGRTPLYEVLVHGRVPVLFRKGNIQALHAVMYQPGPSGKDALTVNSVLYRPMLACDPKDRVHAAAAIEADETIVRLVLKAGADVKARDGDGWPMLHIAVLYSTPGAVRTLLEFSALDQNDSSEIGGTPAQAVLDFGRTSSLIQKQGLKMSDFPWLVEALVAAGRGEKDLQESVAHANLAFQFAAHADAAVLKVLHEAGDVLEIRKS